MSAVLVVEVGHPATHPVVPKLGYVGTRHHYRLVHNQAVGEDEVVRSAAAVPALYHRAEHAHRSYGPGDPSTVTCVLYPINRDLLPLLQGTRNRGGTGRHRR